MVKHIFSSNGTYTPVQKSSFLFWALNPSPHFTPILTQKIADPSYSAWMTMLLSSRFFYPGHLSAISGDKQWPPTEKTGRGSQLSKPMLLFQLTLFPSQHTIPQGPVAYHTERLAPSRTKKTDVPQRHSFSRRSAPQGMGVVHTQVTGL